MMLLNNDYYLDAKTKVLSEELNTTIKNVDILKDVLDAHIKDDSMHFQNSVVIKTEYNEPVTIVNNTNIQVGSGIELINSDKLKQDTIKYLSIGWSATRIQNEINKVPHDLNGYNLMFLFVVPVTYTEDYDEDGSNSNEYELHDNGYYAMNIGNQSIKFNNFINGTLIVAGDNIHDRNIAGNVFKKSKKKTTRQIENPIKYDSLNVNTFLTKFKLEVENPESISKIIEYEDDHSKVAAGLNKIKILGTGFNDDYSVVTFDQNRAKVVVKNISFESTLKSDILSTNTIDLSDVDINAKSPYAEQFIVCWPLESNYAPTIDDTIQNSYALGELSLKKNKLEILEKYVDNEVNGYNYSLISATISAELTPYIDDIMKEYPTYPSINGVYGDFNGLLGMLNELLAFANEDTISANYKAQSEYFTDLDARKYQESLIEMITKTIDRFSYLANIENHPSTKLEKKKDVLTDTYNSEQFIADVISWTNDIQLACSELDAMCSNGNFLKMFLLDRSFLQDKFDDLVIMSNEEFETLRTTYINRLKAPTKVQKKIMLYAAESFVDEMSADLLNIDSTRFSFASVGKAVAEFDYNDLNDFESKTINIGNGNKKYQALHLTESEGDPKEYSYIEINNLNAAKYLMKELFTASGNVKTAYDKDSNDIATICFWAKCDLNKEINPSFISMTVDDRTVFGINRTGFYSTPIAGDMIQYPLSGTLPSNWSMYVFSLSRDNIYKNNLIVDGWQNYYGIDYSSEEMKIKLFSDNILSGGVVENFFADDAFFPSDAFTPGSSHDLKFKFGNLLLSTANTDADNNHYFNGYVRDIMLFAGKLTEEQMQTLVGIGMQDGYSFSPKATQDANGITEFNRKNNFFIGLVGSYDNDDINIINCNFKFDGKTYVFLNEDAVD